MKRICILTALLMMAVFDAAAQMIPVNNKFGKVSKEELELSVYQPDTSAVALVLYENTGVTIDYDSKLDYYQTTSRHIRIKILKEEGLDLADFEIIHYHSDQYKETVGEIEVVTYNLVDGKIVESRMPKSNIYEEQYIDDYKRTSFAATNVKVGSVIEFKYETSTDLFWIIDNVYFQRNIPVNLAECEMRIPKMFAFNTKLHGYHKVNYASETATATLNLNAGNVPYDIQVDKFSVSDLPAFKVEPFIYNTRQYYSSLDYDIRSLALPRGKIKDFSLTWEDVDKVYLESLMMQRLGVNCQFKDEVALVSDDLTDIQKIEEAVKIVRQRITWNGDYREVPSIPAQVVKSGSGSNADINCLLAGCLREMGFEVDPVLIRLRSSGELIDFHPELEAFDTFILRVKTQDGALYYLDGALTAAHVNVLSPLMLVPKARLIRKKECGWVDLTNLSRNNVVMSVNAEVKPDLSYEGKVDARFTGVESYMEKSDYHSYDDKDKYIEAKEEDCSIDIEEFTMSGADEYSSQVLFSYEYTKEADTVSDMVYVSPFLERFHSRNAFQSITRDYPIDFPSAYSVNYMFSLTVPEGYVVEQVPENANLKIAALDATMRLNVQSDGRTVKVIFSYNQKSLNGFVEDYEDIRLFWQYMNDIYDSMIVLKKA